MLSYVTVLLCATCMPSSMLIAIVSVCHALQYVGEDDPLSLITDFLSGYAQRGELSKAEMDILPDLINLRIFSNVIYFTGR